MALLSVQQGGDWEKSKAPILARDAEDALGRRVRREEGSGDKWKRLGEAGLATKQKRDRKGGRVRRDESEVSDDGEQGAGGRGGEAEAGVGQ
jgi:hypothetical protein